MRTTKVRYKKKNDDDKGEKGKREREREKNEARGNRSLPVRCLPNILFFSLFDGQIDIDKSLVGIRKR